MASFSYSTSSLTVCIVKSGLPVIKEAEGFRERPMMRFFGRNASLLFWILSSVLGAVRINRTSALAPVHGKGYSRCAKRAIRTPFYLANLPEDSSIVFVLWIRQSSFALMVFNSPSQFCLPLCLCAYIVTLDVRMQVNQKISVFTVFATLGILGGICPALC